MWLGAVREFTLSPSKAAFSCWWGNKGSGRTPGEKVRNAWAKWRAIKEKSWRKNVKGSGQKNAEGKRSGEKEEDKSKVAKEEEPTKSPWWSRARLEVWRPLIYSSRTEIDSPSLRKRKQPGNRRSPSSACSDPTGKHPESGQRARVTVMTLRRVVNSWNITPNNLQHKRLQSAVCGLLCEQWKHRWCRPPRRR